jgi:hypothetical protein
VAGSWALRMVGNWESLAACPTHTLGRSGPPPPASPHFSSIILWLIPQSQSQSSLLAFPLPLTSFSSVGPPSLLFCLCADAQAHW